MLIQLKWTTIPLSPTTRCYSHHTMLSMKTQHLINVENEDITLNDVVNEDITLTQCCQLRHNIK